MKKSILLVFKLVICISLLSCKDSTSEQFREKLSIDGVVNTSFHNLSEIKKYEKIMLDFSREEQLAELSRSDAAFFLSKLYIDITDESAKINELYTFEVFDQDYPKSVWAAYGDSIDYEFVLDKAENYDEFQKLSVNDVNYYSFRLKDPDSGELYSPLYFFIDSNCVVITGYEDILKEILTSDNENNYWPNVNDKVFHSINIVDFHLYREYGEGFISAVDFDNSLKYITSFDYTFSRSFTGKVVFDAKFTGEDSDKVSKIKEELDKLKLEIIESVARVKNEDMSKFCNSLKISSKGSSVMAKVTVPVSILNMLRYNLINSFSDLLDVYPDIYFDFGDNEVVDTPDYLAEELIEYKETYNYRQDFEEFPYDSPYNTARLETRVEISEIGYTEDGKHLYITVGLTPMAGKELNWQYRYLDFGIKSVTTDFGNVNFSEEYGIDRLPSDKTVGESGYIEQTIVLPEGVKHSDIRDIVTRFTFLEPKEVQKITVTKSDINKTIELGSGYFTLLSLDRSFVYNFRDKNDSLIEVRALNSKGEALYSSGGGSSWIKYPNGLKTNRISPAVEGNTQSIELYYVSKFEKSHIDMPHAVAADFSDLKEKKDSDVEQFKVVPFNPNDYPSPLPVDNFFESGIDSWPSASSGSFDIYLRGLSEQWELALDLYIKAPDHPVFRTSLSSFELIIDEITTNSGDIIKRPDMETIKKWEKENNTFDKDFSWTMAGPFLSTGKYSVLRNTLNVGIDSSYGGLKSFKGHVVFALPTSAKKIRVEKLLVGDTIESGNIKLQVEKFEGGKYHLKIVKGLKKLVQVRAIDPDSEVYKELEVDLLGDILKVDPVSMHEEYEFTISTKNSEYRYNFSI